MDDLILSDEEAEELFGPPITDEGNEEFERQLIERLPELLRGRSCPAGVPWTGDDPSSDHGHTDCYFHHLAAKEIERLRALITDAYREDIGLVVWARHGVDEQLRSEYDAWLAEEES